MQNDTQGNNLNNSNVDNPNSAGQVANPNVPNNIPAHQRDLYQNGQAVNNQQNNLQGQNQQQPKQPFVPSPSPEFPARVEPQETGPSQEVGVEIEGNVEQQRQVEQETEPKQIPAEKKDKVEPPPKQNDDQVDENPYKVYGYKISKKVAEKQSKKSGNGVKGNPSAASTWLMVLLDKLVRLYQA